MNGWWAAGGRGAVWCRAATPPRDPLGLAIRTHFRLHLRDTNRSYPPTPPQLTGIYHPRSCTRACRELSLSESRPRTGSDMPECDVLTRLRNLIIIWPSGPLEGLFWVKDPKHQKRHSSLKEHSSTTNMGLRPTLPRLCHPCLRIEIMG